MADGSGFFAELKRRHVWRVAIAYVVTAWIVLQLASVMLPSFGAPGWVMRVLFGILVILFPIALVLAWALEITPQGVRLTAPAGSPGARETTETRALGRKLNTGIIVALVIAVALLAGNQFIWHAGMRRASRTAPNNTAAAKAASASKAVPAKSIAVLPFENLSTDKANAYFADGMQDLILTKLADVGGLKVISRTSTMKYASRPDDLKTIAQQLGVATILEGSVQKQGNEVLINVQLIDAATDAHLWAQSYTRTLDNVFGVEGEVAGKIATALNARLSPAQDAELAAVPTRNSAAYDAYLRAEYLVNRNNTNYGQGDMSGFKAAIPLYRRAVAADPTFALAWARLSVVESRLAWWGGAGEGIPQRKAEARADAAQAVKLAPDLAAAQIAQGYVAYYGETDYPKALATFAAVLKLKPNDADAWVAQGYVQRLQGQFDAAITSLQRALALDPRNSALATDLGRTYMQVSRFAEAGQAFQRALALDPNNLNARHWYPFAILYASGDVAKALVAAQGEGTQVTLLTYQRQYTKALALLDGIPDTPHNFKPVIGASKAQWQADLYALRGDTAKARAFYAADLPKARAAIDATRIKGFQSARWSRVADDELGLGHTAQGVADIARSQALVDQAKPPPGIDFAPIATEQNASLYAKARRPDLAVPLLARALARPDIFRAYSPVLLWLDPAWDPIRASPQFQALLATYAKYKPAVTYPAAPASAPPPPPPL